MPKTEAQKKFDSFVSQIIWPHFKQRGYKKTGNNFRYYNAAGWGKIINFQKSLYYSKEHIHFTVNVGLYLAEAENFISGIQSGIKFQEPTCIIRQRIGSLNDTRNDIWFDITSERPSESIFSEVEKLFIKYAIPYLDAIHSKEDILNLLLNGYNSLYKRAQIQTLFVNGYNEAATRQLRREIERISDQSGLQDYLDSLLQIQQSFIN